VKLLYVDLEVLLYASGGGARFSAPVRTGPPSLPYNGYRVFPRGKVWPGRDADASPLLVPRSKIE